MPYPLWCPAWRVRAVPPFTCTLQQAWIRGRVGAATRFLVIKVDSPQQQSQVHIRRFHIASLSKAFDQCNLVVYTFLLPNVERSLLLDGQNKAKRLAVFRNVTNVKFITYYSFNGISHFQTNHAKIEEIYSSIDWVRKYLWGLGFGYLPARAPPYLKGRSCVLSPWFGLLPCHLHVAFT